MVKKFEPPTHCAPNVKRILVLKAYESYVVLSLRNCFELYSLYIHTTVGMIYAKFVNTLFETSFFLLCVCFTKCS